ncbi:TPA: tetratricopeptide repeat protein [Bacillus pseudomycoides]|nr:tetratricopeptide repeat protein [Bacillus pseudomycoides]
MNVSVKGNEQITKLLNNWYIEVRSRNLSNAHLLKIEIDKRIDDVKKDQNLLLYYSLLDFRYQYVIDNIGVSAHSFDEIEAFDIPKDNLLTYYYHFFKAIHASTIGNYTIAKDNYDKAESILEFIKDDVEHAEFYYKLGAFHYDIYDSLKAIHYVNKAKDIFLKHNNSDRNIGFCENLLGMCCINLKEYELAEEHLVKAMDIFQKLGEDKYTIMVRHNLGVMYSEQNMSELAIRHLSEVHKHKPSHYKAMLIEGKERLKLEDSETAITLFNRGLNICNNLGNKEYQHRFNILKAISENISIDKLEDIILAGVEYFNREKLHKYIYEYLDVLAHKYYGSDNHIKASKYFYLSSQAQKQAFEEALLK